MPPDEVRRRKAECVQCGPLALAGGAHMAAETVRVYAGRGAVTQLMLGVVCAALYGVALWATSFLPTIPGVTWLRPANMLSELFAVNFGWIGALGIAFGKPQPGATWSG